MFAFADSLKEVTIPASVSKIEINPFLNCNSLKTVKFMGDAPTSAEGWPFGYPNKEIIIYYNPETSGWDTTALKDDYTLVPYQ